MNNRNAKLIEQELAKAKQEVTKLEHELKTINSYTPAQHLAIALHDKLWNRVNEDGWYYDQTWDGFAHKLYLDKANKLINTIERDLPVADTNRAFNLAVKIVEAL